MKSMAHQPRFRWQRVSRVTRFTFLIIIVLLVAARIALPHFVASYVNRKLDELPEYDGQIAEVDIHLLRGAYSIHGIDIVKTAGKTPVPFVKIKQADLSVEWKELFHGGLVGEIYIDDAQLNFVRAENDQDSQTSVDESWIQVVKDLFPFRINRFVIRDSEVWFHDIQTDPQVDLYINGLFAVATNLTNTRNLNTPLPADFKFEGQTLGNGRVKAHVKADPLASDPTFRLAAELTDLDLVALNELLEAYARINVKRGTFEMFTEIEAEDGAYVGYVKPFMVDLDVFELKKDIKNPLRLAWQAIVAGATQLFKNHPKDQVATRIPVSGTFEQTDVGLLTTIANLLRNAFVEALKPSLDRDSNLPPIKDEETKSKIK